MRILLRELSPGTSYQVQLRAKDDNGNSSQWSRVFGITTTADSVPPNTPTGVTGSMAGTAFQLVWNAVTTSTDGTPAHDLDRYEILVDSPGVGTTKVYTVKGTTFLFTLDMNRQLFGSPRANIRMQVRAVDAVNNASAYSTPIVDQTNPAPANPANFTLTPLTDAIATKWDAVADTDLLYYRVYSGTTAGTQTTQVWQGLSTSATIPSTTYLSDRWYKVTSVDVFGTESSGTVAGPVRPNSPFAVDTVAPATPAGLTAVLTTASDTTTSAQVSWTATPDTDGDLSNYIVDYRPVGASDWQTVNVDYTKTSVKIDRLTPYVNYDFRIRSADFSANLSAYSSTVTTTTAATNTAPAAVTGLIGVAGASSVTVLWTEASELDVKNGAGMYEVQMDTANTFATGNLKTIKTAATVASFLTDGLPAGNRYIRVRAIDSLGLAGTYSTTLTLNQTDISATEGYAQSRGMNLVTNGFGVLGTNKNFSTFTFDAADRPFGGGSFKTTASGPVVSFNDELIPVDTAKGYVLTAYARQQNPLQLGARFYAGFAGYDIDGLAINSQMTMFLPNTQTTLATTLSPGATTVTLTSTANWQNGAGIIYDRAFIFWNWVDTKGYAYPPGTYSRNYYTDNTNGMWPAGGISGNVITLTNPWSGPTIPAGTPVSNSTAGGTYKYTNAVNVIAPQTWTKYQGRIAGVDYSGQNVTNAFSPGTAYIKLLFLSHYPTLTAGQTSTIAYAGMSVSEVDGANLLPSTMGGDVVIANTLAGDRVIANSLDANTLKANTSFIQDLNVKSTFTLGDATTVGAMRSYEYLNTAGASGWRMSDNSLVIKSGIIEAAALRIQNSPNLLPPQYADFEYGNDYYISNFWRATGQGLIYLTNGISDSVASTTVGETVKGKRYFSWNQPFNTNPGQLYFGLSTTDYNINVEPGKTYIFSVYMRNRDATATSYNINIKGDTGAQIATQSYSLGGNEAAYVRRSLAVTVPAGVNKVLIWMERPSTGTQINLWLDCAQFEEKTGTDNTPSVWKPPGSTTVDGSGIVTGQIRSNVNVTVGTNTLPAWSINTQGNIQLGDALVRGKLIVGDGTDLVSTRMVNNDFESTINGASAYQTGDGTLTTATASRTTTAGEIISGTGSFKVATTVPTLPNGRKTLGGVFILDTPIVGPADVTITFSLQSDEPTASTANYWGNYVALGNSTIPQDIYDTPGVGVSPTANTPYTYTAALNVVAGHTYDRVTIAKATFLSGTDYLAATKVMVDDISVTTSADDVGSYASSYNFVSGVGGSGWRIDGSGNAEFNSGVFRGQLGAGIVTAETLSSTITISSNFRTADTGKRVEFNSDGIIAYRSDGTSRVIIPTDDITAASFDGDLLAQSLTISDQLAIRGTNNELSKGATLTLASGTTSPTSPPTVNVSWKTYPCTNSPTFDPYRYGITVQGGWFRVPVVVYGVGTVVESYSLTTGARQYGSLNIAASNGMWNNLGGCTSIGNNFYALGQRQDGSWRLMGWTFGTGVSGTPTRFLDVAYTQGPNDRLPALGNDGTNLLITLTNTTDNLIRYKTANATTGVLTSSVASNLAYGADMAFINKGVFDSGFGGSTVYVAGARTGQTAWVFNTSFQRMSQYDFSTNGKPQGQCFYNGKFYTFDATGGKITEHTNITWNASTTTSTWWAGNTWYNTDATNGNKQTTIGPLKSFTMKQRAMVTMTSPPIPLRPVPNTVDDATAAGFYIARNSSTPSRTMLELYGYLADGVRVTTIESNPSPFPAPGGAAAIPPPSSTDIPATSPSVLKSANARFTINGDGSGDWADLDVSATGVLTIPNRLAKAVATGSVSVPIVNTGTTNTIAVTFPSGRFASAPVVIINGSASSRLTATATAITATGFNMQHSNWSPANSSAGTSQWFAYLE